MTEYRPRRVFVTGGCGFIGSNFVRHLLKTDPAVSVVNLDALTYAGNPANLRDVAQTTPDRYSFVKGDIRDALAVRQAMSGCDSVVHFAAESHVDRSIVSANDFIATNVAGTHVLLEEARCLQVARFLQISTDEVYGSIETGSFSEEDRLSPSSAYSASKAAADLLVLASHTTHGLPVLITRSSNNFGPYQFPEKLIPLFVTNLLEGRSVPLYGDGLNVRDWLFVEDNCVAIDRVLRAGMAGEIYNIGAGNEVTNKDVALSILSLLDAEEQMIDHVTDRPGHDRRYSVDCRKVRTLGWTPSAEFSVALARTVEWYSSNKAWWEPLKTASTFQRAEEVPGCG